MPTDFTLPVRQSVVAHLKADAAVTALVSASRIYGEESPIQPEYPFIRYGLPFSAPYEATCWDGSTHRVTIHVFARGPFTDAAARIAKAVVASIDTLDLGALSLVDSEWVGNTWFRDTDETSLYHVVCEFDLTAVSVAA